MYLCDVVELTDNQQPMAVALRFDVDFDDMFTDSAGLMSFSSQLQEGVPFLNESCGSHLTCF